MQLQSVNQVASRLLTWFWLSLLALGKLAIRDGDRGRANRFWPWISALGEKASRPVNRI
jgi:hypothetical protein